MTPDQWKKAKGLFDEILKLPPNDRLHFLHENDDGDQAVRAEVESLIANCVWDVVRLTNSSFP